MVSAFPACPVRQDVCLESVIVSEMSCLTCPRPLASSSDFDIVGRWVNVPGLPLYICVCAPRLYRLSTAAPAPKAEGSIIPINICARQKAGGLSLVTKAQTPRRQ